MEKHGADLCVGEVIAGHKLYVSTTPVSVGYSNDTTHREYAQYVEGSEPEPMAALRYTIEPALSAEEPDGSSARGEIGPFAIPRDAKAMRCEISILSRVDEEAGSARYAPLDRQMLPVQIEL